MKFCDRCFKLYSAKILDIGREYPILDNCRSMPKGYAFGMRRALVNELGLCMDCRKLANELMDRLEAKHQVAPHDQS